MSLINVNPNRVCAFSVRGGVGGGQIYRFVKVNVERSTRREWFGGKKVHSVKFGSKSDGAREGDSVSEWVSVQLAESGLAREGGGDGRVELNIIDDDM